MGKHAKKKSIHRPGSLIESRPAISPNQKARFERLSWEANPERYAQRTWAQIKQWVEG